MTTTDPLVGRLVDGRYQVEGRVAKGGMATVYTARDTRLDRVVALKVMHRNLAEDEAFVTRFIREARSAAGLSHPNVVAVYDQGEDDGVVYLTMEYVQGRTLRQVLQERGRLRQREALEVAERVLAALGAAHRAGLVHRDVKPENVLISDDGRVKVADFGLARAVATSPHTRTTGIILGTVAYLAPEQVEHGTADARSDVYATGILLYEMLVGQVPFRADTPIAVAYKHVHEDVPPPSAAVPVDARVDRLVAYATDRDPQARPADASELLTEVTAVRRDLPEDEPLDLGAPVTSSVDDADNTTLLLSGGSPPEPAATPKRKRRGLVALLLVVVLAALAGFGGWWFGTGRWTTTPDLTGVTTAAARSKAEQVGLKTSTASGYSESVPRGEVASTRPAPGGRILRGGTVALVVSLGPERHAVPTVKGEVLSEAEADLSKSRLSVGDVRYRYSATVARNVVLSSSPEAGRMLKRGTKVDLVVSRGVPPVTVPGVVGMRQAAAVDAIKHAGLVPSVTEAPSKHVPKGEVASQRPDHGAKRARGATVALVVSNGPPLVAVPEVKGLPVAQAKKQLTDAGFTVSVEQIPFGGNKVFQQSRHGKAPYGSAIRIWVF
ncbi:MAG: Stk1 family PASTA domain-containing Ser/Thr kinase [Streptosporangiales bacterium]|nr:Stk1 family PASTA domain-containing Ser/Thr kinase [Streptosporangiales bacterium]MBO0890370.1 Stk1 family PASTA domain-containing Ser/Thr kinase [Acidothermales bacterium]